MKTILVTGAAGFIGQRTAKLLLDKGYKVVGIDNMNDYYDIRIKEHRLNQIKDHDNFTFFKQDIEDLPALHKIADEHKIDIIINLAARAGVRYSMEHPHIYLSTNTLGMLNLLDVMIKKGIQKIILASTSSLYAGQKMPFSEDLPVNEPISPYAASKKAAEAMAYSYYYLYNIDVCILRYFTVYGPSGRPDMSIFRFIKWIDEDKPIILFGDGTQSRDFTYIDDIADGTIKALNATGFNTINLGGGENPVSINYIISLIEKHLGKKAKIDFKPFHKADMMETKADITRAGKLLGWKPQTGVEKGIENSVNWYLENRDWISDIQL